MGTTESRCPWQMTIPPECWPRLRGEVQNVATFLKIMRNALVLHIEARRLEAAPE
jgi:hypothetical protein